MSRIYEDKALANSPVIPEPVPGGWQPADMQRGPGVVLEGKLRAISRHHIIESGKSTHRYFILYIEPTRIHKRQFDSAGVETEPNFSETKKVNTGYLMSSFKVEPAGQTDKISVEDLKRLINKPELIKISEKHTPSHSLAFWILEGEMENIELQVEDGLRLKTLGDSPFIFSLAKMDAGTVTKCNFAGGEKVGTSWTDNVFAAKCKTEQEAKTSTQGEGVDEDEWSEDMQQQIIRETFHLVSRRDENVCNFLEGGSLIGGSDYKLIYRHYATLYFLFCVDSSESELGILDLIQVFVETLDKCFENVCELDLIFHMDKVHCILQEVVMGGMVLETNMTEIVSQVEAQTKLEKSEAGFSGAPARAVSAVKNINLPDIPRNIKVSNLSPFV
ncbi:arpin isoform X4 [Hemiscyllium ocellatum]|uniref:arpin isoform X4 n=1 Tax=Hemiscyllium ocellatum TaxID=170820 RepID=UPI00296727E5|nr:arpin isoform X4 [Hemiscyllium ocellatum]